MYYWTVQLCQWTYHVLGTLFFDVEVRRTLCVVMYILVLKINYLFSLLYQGSRRDSPSTTVTTIFSSSQPRLGWHVKSRFRAAKKLPTVVIFSCCRQYVIFEGSNSISLVFVCAHSAKVSLSEFRDENVFDIFDMFIGSISF